MTVFLLICLLLILPLLAGASYFGYQVFSLLVITLITLMLISVVELLYVRRKFVIGKVEPEREVVRGKECVFSIPVSLTTKWLPVGARLSAYYGHSDKSVKTQSKMIDLDLCAGDRGDIHFAVLSRHTGMLSLDEAVVEVKSVFGLFKYRKRYLNEREAMQTLVLPRTDQRDETTMRALDRVDESDLEHRRVNERSDQIETMRAYQDGDDVRSMHWPVSSRLSSLIIKQYEAPISAETHILFDDYTGYSLEIDEKACDQALDYRDQILDSVAGSIHWMLTKEISIQLHLGLGQNAWERLHISQDHMRYKRILASLAPDSMPTLAELIHDQLRFDANDRYLLFSRRLSEATASAIIHLARHACQAIFFYFKPDETSREEDNALRMMRQSSVEVIQVNPFLLVKEQADGKGNTDV